MNFVWFLCVMGCITGALFYNIAVKVAGDHINPFIFTSGLSGVAVVGHLCCLCLYKFYLGENVNFQADRLGIGMVFLGGLGAVIVDLSFYFALKNGSMIATSLLWTLGGIILTALAAVFVFKEPVTVTKMAGLGLGMISFYLLSKPA